MYPTQRRAKGDVGNRLKQKKRNKCGRHALTCLEGEMFHSLPRSSDVVPAFRSIRQAASLSLTCLMPSKDWKVMEINNVAD